MRVAVSNHPYWQSDRVVPRPPLSGDVAADVAIVGGGIGGLATAWHLAERGIRSTIVEARTVASGASGRNGGFLIAGAAPMYNDARALFGDDLARRIHAATLAGQGEVYDVAGDIGAGDSSGVSDCYVPRSTPRRPVTCASTSARSRSTASPGGWSRSPSCRSRCGGPAARAW